MPKTLLHFFSPKSVKKEENGTSSPKSNSGTPLKPKNTFLTPKSEGKILSKKTFLTPKSEGKIPSKKSPFFSPMVPAKTIECNVCDIVWAKLDGYPWWPSIVCNDPTDGVHEKREGKKKFIHVQFFDNPVTHAYVEAKNVEIYDGSQSLDFQIGGKFYSPDLDVIEATKKGDEALKKGVEGREKLLVKFEDSFDDFADDLDDMLADACDNSVASSNNEVSMEIEEGKRPKRKAVKKAAKKRRRIETHSDEDDCVSEEDFDPNKESESDESDEDVGEESSDLATESEPDDSPIKDSRKRKRKGSLPAPKISNTPSNSKLAAFNPTTSTTSRTPLVCQQTKSRLSLFQASETEGSMGDDLETTKYLHETLEFLFPENLRDKHGRKTGDPDYDSTSLKIPQEFLKKCTPAMFQWWKLKVDHFDVIFCFKVGKFYELYHMDAVVGVNELGLIYMRGSFAHSGFPEVAFGRYSESLVQKGYKVARVEQTETPEQNAIRIKKGMPSKQEKTLRREICRIVTKGTQSLGSWPGSGNMHSGNNFLLAVTEKSSGGNNFQEGVNSNVCREFGICFIDTSVGLFHIGQFMDDRHCSALCTMLSHYTPCQILFERGHLSASLQKILRSGLSSILQEPLLPGTQFWDATKTMKFLKTEGYFEKNGEDDWPTALKSMMQDAEAVSFSAAKNYELAISAFGACVFYLKKCLIDYEVISMKQFVEYKPPKSGDPQYVAQELEDAVANFAKGDNKMILDSVTLANLEILENTNGGTEGTLIERLDHCHTAFGKRLLRQWLCAPPCNPEVSSDRLDALEDLMGCQEFVSETNEVLKKVPDLERMLMKIHSLSKDSKKPDHPDNRAVLYEEDKYSKKKIEDFLTILQNYECVHKLLVKHQDLVKSFRSSLLQKILGLSSENGNFPNMSDTLKRWKTAFNHTKAVETGKITPNHGANPEYDSALDEIADIQAKLNSYLKEQKKHIGCSSIVYKGTGNKRYQLEMPIDVADRKNLSGYTISGQRKGFKSFRTAETEEFLKEMEAAEARRDSAQSETMAIIFREFDQDFAMWNSAVQCLSILDVLLSLTEYCKNSEIQMCRPILSWKGANTSPFLDISTGRHPCVTRTFFGDDFIPNDTLLGCQGDDNDVTNNPNCLVLTGPNMGGKSTLMRQVGLIVVLAHLGCYVPAEHCRLSPVDRVFTRLGASDRIMSGESTFYVELSETSAILKHATKHSLVLLDELGRGTATYDGTAIALAVVREISANIKSRTIFSTHYHTVVDDLKDNADVKQGHMACMVENEDADNEDPSKETLTFLYKLTDGPCPKSYGFHAARLADVPESVITLARHKAAELESNNNNVSMFRSICQGNVPEKNNITV
uniref:DNA mismatch repair protein Msh6-like n=1 Tax=Styela clava TaxID=7725 RepID=UPI00193A5805|nr:DNA mismatch repair protein Msh6-like [Styela clava]